jgi:hypothetical protein
MGPGGQKLKPKVDALQLSAEGLFKLLGSGDPNKKEQFWEIVKGITTPAVYRMVENELTIAANLLTQAEATVKTLTQNAKELGAGGAASAGH